MRRIKVVLAVLAVTVTMLASAAPAMADNWWDDCNWHWSWWWGWFMTCENSGGWGPSWEDNGWQPVSDDDSWEPVDDGGDWERVG